MVSNFEGKFIMRGFTGPVDDDSWIGLNTMLSSLYKVGDVLELSVRVKRVGTRALCDAKTKYGTCREPLDADGTCHNPSQSHVVEESEEEVEETA
jgi:hypothetical protein